VTKRCVFSDAWRCRVSQTQWCWMAKNTHHNVVLSLFSSNWNNQLLFVC